MKLSIITINYNDAAGLKRTLDSVAAQATGDRLQEMGLELEHLVIDGGSTDASVDVINEYEKRLMDIGGALTGFGVNLKWISEKDKGIYNAMNKGILMATGDYVQILNSGDILASNDVLARMWVEIRRLDDKAMMGEVAKWPEMIYGNMIKKDYATEKIVGKSGEVPYSLLQYFTSTMNHDCCWIKQTLFVNHNHNDKQNLCYGFYDEGLKIVSDWKWFLQAIGLGKVQPVYVDIDMTIFDASGISEKNLELRNEERRKVLKEMLPPAVLADYDRYAFPVHQVERLRKYHLWGLVYFVERILFKLEKWHILK